MGIRELKFRFDPEGLMSKKSRVNPKWVKCRDCGFIPDRKVVQRRCRKCGGGMRVIRYFSDR